MSHDHSRSQTAEQLAREELDLLVIGGGIVGAGIARDAAMRGLRVGLIEQHDLAFGTSSRSSRLLHGGLRYLAQGRLGLVREASIEKRILHRIAPHLAAPLAFVFPAYRGTPWPLWQLRMGVKLYDLLCGGRNLGPSNWLTTDQLLQHLPGIHRENLTGAVRYYDGLTNDARLVIDTLRSAAQHGALVLNYTRFETASHHAHIWHCRLSDTAVLPSGKGDRHLLPERLEGCFAQKVPAPLSVTARAVINATGPWAQSVPHSRVRLRLTKGVHLVVDRPRLPLPDAVVMAAGKRILFAIPWGERLILGTTDTDYRGPIEAVSTEPADVAYILDVVDRFFSTAGLTAADVISTWAGLRPLIASGRGGPSDISRAHQIHMPEPGWFDVAGGKLTTYRLIAEQVVDRVVRHLGRRVPPCRTAEEPLLPPEQVGFSGIEPPPVAQQAVEHYCTQEWAMHLDDVMRRHTSWHYYRTDANAVAERVADWMADILSWDAARREAELTRYREMPA